MTTTMANTGNTSSELYALPANLDIGFRVVHLVLGVPMIFGNSLVVVAVARFVQLRKIHNVFLVSLALADIAVGLTVIPCNLRPVLLDLGGEAVGGAPRHPLECIACVGSPIMTTGASFLSVLLVSIERYVKIVHHEKYHDWMSRKRAVVSTACIWVYAIAIGAVIPFFWNDYESGSLCTLQDIGPRLFQLIFVLIPIGSLLVANAILYGLILYKAASQRRKVMAQTTGVFKVKLPERSAIVERRVNTMILMLVALLYGCYTPYVIVGFVTPADSMAYHVPRLLALTLVYSASFVNPLIYSWKSPEFRRAFRALLTCRRDAQSVRIATVAGGV